MTFKVFLKKKVLKSLDRMPALPRARFDILYKVLERDGPTAPFYWQNYSKLSGDTYHCHLTHHYVACWRHEKKTIIIEVYYVGSRENAPYG